MSKQVHRPTWRIRFRLLTLIVAIGVVAVALVAGRYAYDWFTSTPLADAVAAFNAKARSHPVGEHEPALSEDEVVSSITSQLPSLDTGIKDIYARIARTRRLPRGASLYSTAGYKSGATVETLTVWWIKLDVMTGARSGYTLRIRATDDPVAAEPRVKWDPTKQVVLSLRDRNISGEELPDLLEGYSELRELDLSYNPLSDEALAHLQLLTKLEIIHLEHTGITDKGLQHLDKLPSLKEVIHYRGPGHRTTEDGRRKLREAIPGLKMPFITH